MMIRTNRERDEMQEKLFTENKTDGKKYQGKTEKELEGEPFSL
jgi:hypothetical protein